MGIKVCLNQGDCPFWGPDRGYNRGNCGDLKNIALTNQWPECIDNCMKQPWHKEIQVCANKVPGVIRGNFLKIF